MNGVWFSYFAEMPSLPALRSNGLCQEKQILIHKENQTHVNKGLSDDITYLPTVAESFRNVYMFGFLYCYKTEDGAWFSYFTEMPSLPALRSNGLCQEKQIFIKKIRPMIIINIRYFNLSTNPRGGSFSVVYTFGFLYFYKNGNGVWFSYFAEMPSLPALRSNGLFQEKQILIH